MNLNEFLALSLDPNLNRVALGARLRADDPNLLESSRAHLPALAGRLAEAAAIGISAVAWNDPRFSCCPPGDP